MMVLSRYRWSISLLIVAIAVPASWWGWQNWQQRRILSQAQQALATGDVVTCLDQLAKLSTTQQPPALLNDCRWQRSQQLAAQGNFPEALQLALLIPASDRQAAAAQAAARRWGEQVRAQAEQQFLAGNWPAAQKLLNALPAQTPLDPAPSVLLSRWQQQWQQDSQAITQARVALEQARWWDVDRALAKLSDHPYWQPQAQALRQQAQQSIQQLAQQRPNATTVAEDGTVIDSVAEAALEPRYRQYLAQGLSDYEAWQRACQDLGGQVIDRGPEAFCSRNEPS
ncbi:hypothetical protein VZG28_05575 [Synechococcus elongatus IITB4]|uniref:hypothetical protein n=1 Tax=Synechococcus elongatus TaxID=32046 RepID=UPI0030CC8BFE